MYRNPGLLGGDSEFVLTNGGHITPCIAMPGNQRSRYFVNADRPADTQAWLQGAREETGSWLSHWQRWLANRSGEQIAAPTPGSNRRYPALCEAPGEYVFN